MNSLHSIGVFDSGLGGLSVLGELRELLPCESFVYLGDAARLPYGTKSRQTVIRYSLQCARFLERYRLKALIVACNTASAMAIDSLREAVEIPVFGVIDAGVEAGIAATRNRRILVLATEATRKSEAYERAFATRSSEVLVQTIACPLLVPLVEAGWIDHPVTESVIREYLKLASPGFDTVLFGCTHYPFLEPVFKRVCGEGIALTHGGPLLALALRRKLEELDKLSSPSESGGVRYLSTDAVPRGAFSSVLRPDTRIEIVEF